MKKRLIVLVLAIIIFLTTIFFGLFIKEEIYRRILLAISLITITYFSIYIFFGTGKLVTSLIYGMILALMLSFLSQYDIELIFITTFILFLNPLHKFEDFIDERLDEDKSIIEYLRGTYVSYYKYRKDLKEHYHLPQVRKTFTKPGYLMARRALTVIMAMVAIFLLLREVNNLMNLIKNFRIELFFASSYSIIILLSLTVILYRKGFQSMTNFLTVSVFPPFAYSAYLAINPPLLGLIIGLVIMAAGIAVGFMQYFAFRSRIVYEYYYYFDQERLVSVYANALFEPYVYDENFRLTTVYTINVDEITFNKNFQNIVLYADWHKFFITAYTVTNGQVVIYTDFHYKDENKIIKFKHFLESAFEININTKMTEDSTKGLYEELFFHQNDYIIARTLYLANILKQLEIKSSVIVSLTAYFESLDNVEAMSAKYLTTRLPNLDIEGIYTVKFDLRIVNTEYIIENKIRELLLDLLINRGSYVRVKVFY